MRPVEYLGEPFRIGPLVLRNRLLLAPMAGVTDLPFRLMARGFGCALAFTEMVSAQGLVREAPRTFSYLDTNDQDRPLGVQIFGAEPSVMAEAARIVADRGADLIDINMGCPVKKVVRTGSGAALLRDPEGAARIVAAVRRATGLPLTVKIRSGWSPGEITAPLIARLAQEEGADALIVHPRTARDGFGGRADWGLIAAIKAALSIPVIGNGDVIRPVDAERMVKETGCDAVMIGRGALGAPWLFGEILGCETGGGRSWGRWEDRMEIIIRHFRLVEAYGGPGGRRGFRKHLLWYTRGMPGGALLRRSLGRMDEGTLLAGLAEGSLVPRL
ncbi:MAG TPA: tRNA dihydrouridine synthase DusB [Syntrophales bacterium]|nr:tRNA dihydrouridine synthase DusB [Syntrophales bacterium]HRV43468.1 tRNA dihydrouridine synthase DusB [Syntrophales bacterium]